MESLNIVVISQARIGSTRLPSKVLLKIGDNTLLDIHLQRIKKSKYVNKIIVATTLEKGTDQICEIAKNHGALCYKGSTNDVLDRFYQAAMSCDADWIIRVTSDCPLIDAQLLDSVVKTAIDGDFDYFANNLVEDFPDGQDMEVFKMSVLREAWLQSSKKSEREHVTPYIRDNSDFNGGTIFKARDYAAPENFNNIRMTIDEQTDFDTMNWLIGDLGIDKTWKEYAEHIIENPESIENATIIRNEGYHKSLRNEE